MFAAPLTSSPIKKRKFEGDLPPDLLATAGRYTVKPPDTRGFGDLSQVASSLSSETVLLIAGLISAFYIGQKHGWFEDDL
jgi:hypothetical protein